MAKPFLLSLKIRMQTPLSSGAAGATGPVLADKVVVRNGLGEYILPGSQLRGVLRHACERLLRAMDVPVCHGPQPVAMCPHYEEDDAEQLIGLVSDPFDVNRTVRQCALCAIFGSPYFPSPIQFHDLVCDNPFRGNAAFPYTDPQDARLGAGSVRPMVSLNRRRGVAEGKRLFFIETTPPQSQFTFANDTAVVGTLQSETQGKLLLAGLRTIIALGGSRSRGFGWVEIDADARFDDLQIKPGGWETLQELSCASK